MSANDSTAPIEYREIPECPGYRFGSDGSGWVYRPSGRWYNSDDDWVPLRVHYDKGAGRRVWVRCNGKGQRFWLVHVVCWAFHGPCPSGWECRRIDGDSSNDRSDNLEWGSWQADLALGRKRCTKCREPRPLEEFQAHAYTRDRLSDRCKACLKEDRETIYTRPEAREKRSAWRKRSKLKYRYGITDAEFDRLNNLQGGVCAICGKPPEGGPRTQRLHVDHSHDTGKVRGLICLKCNSALAQFGDSIEGLMRAVDYLRRAEET